jgi:hypothetical protein
MQYTFLVKYSSCLAIADAAQEMEYIGPRRLWVVSLASIVAYGEWNIVVNTASMHRANH